MKRYKSLFFISLVFNIILLSAFLYKLHNNWFEPAVLKEPFRTGIFNALPKDSGKIYFVGDSHTEAFELNEILHNTDVRNRGIWGDNSAGVLKRIAPIIQSHPSKLFLMIGVNDICSGVKPAQTLTNVRNIIEKIQAGSPQTKIYLQSILPTNQPILHSSTPTIEVIQQVNQSYKELSAGKGITYIDLFPCFVEGNGMKPEYTFEGLHLTGKGYMLWRDLLLPYLNN